MLNKIEKIGYVGFKWNEAPWDAATTYTPRSLVVLNQTIYYAKKESTDVDPRTDNSHEYWAVFVDNSATYAAAVAAETAAIKAKDATASTEAATEQATKTIAEMVEKIKACISATESANTAADRANASADAADAATERANTASGKSEGLIADTDKALKTATEITAKANTLIAGVEQAERERIASESERDTAEQHRVQNELVRAQGEQARNANENTRKGDESARKESERQREQNENIRMSNEDERIESEDARVESEDARNKAEKARAEAEVERAKAESARKESETQREAGFAASKQAADAATDKALDVSAHAPYVDADGYYYKYNADTKAYDKTDVNLTGKAFTIKKVFASVEAMNAVSADTFAENDFILINTADVEDEDNAKLYVVALNEQGQKFYSYLVDMSGFRGFTGKTPQIVVGTVTTLASGDSATASLTADGVDADGNPKYKLSFAIPKGDKLTFADLTDSDIAILQKPALESAKKADAAVETVNSTNTSVQRAEATRAEAESGRVDAEKQRVSDENIRKQNETTRGTNEESRKTEEQKRATAETTRKTAEDARIAAESARNTAENSRSQAEVARNNAETSRAQAESKRVAAETKRETDFAASKKACDDATQAANTATTNAETATTKAENVNVTITEDNAVEVTDRDGNKKSISLAEQAATKATLDKQEQRLGSLEQAVGELGGSVDKYYYASQDTSKASPDLVNPQTNTSIQMLQDMYRPYLIDHTDNDREKMIGYELKRNNYLRYADGTFAPAVGITEEQRAACDVELYLDAEHTQKYCEAGAFDAEAFYNEYGLSQKLYDVSGNEIAHILRPWETTSKTYSIKIGDPTGNYLIDGYSTNDGEEDIMYKGILKAFRDVAGIKARYLEPTLLSPCQDTSIKDTDGKVKFRSFFFLYNAGGDGNTIGGSGNNGGSMFKEANRCYPRVNDVNQITSMTYARNNNVDASKTYPFAEAGFHAYNTFIIAHELLYGTNYLNDPDNLFSSGTSSNNGVGNEAQWKKYGGVRIKVGDDDTWKYLNWNSQSNWIYKDANNTVIGTHMSNWLNQEYPKWQEMEAQIALSFAAEQGIAENTEFEVYGHTYWYVTPPKAKGISDGYMNARLYRKVTGDWQGYDASGNAVTYHIEAILRQGVMDGMVTAGDIFHYRGGGYEQVAINHCDKTSGQTAVNDIDLYIQPDQKAWHTEKVVSKNDLGAFDFEKSYEHVYHAEKVTYGCMKKRAANTPNLMLNGANVNTYACAFVDNTNWYSSMLNQRVRTAVRLGGIASWNFCASRSLIAAYACSNAARAYGGSAQCLFEAASQGAARPKPLQAE